MFEVTSLSRHETCVAPLDKRRASKHQALLGAGEAEIVVTAVFTETPDFVDYYRPIIGDLYVLIPMMSTLM
jgi:hypothetical protein